MSLSFQMKGVQIWICRVWCIRNLNSRKYDWVINNIVTLVHVDYECWVQSLKKHGTPNVLFKKHETHYIDCSLWEFGCKLYDTHFTSFFTRFCIRKIPAIICANNLLIVSLTSTHLLSIAHQVFFEYKNPVSQKVRHSFPPVVQDENGILRLSKSHNLRTDEQLILWC